MISYEMIQFRVVVLPFPCQLLIASRFEHIFDLFLLPNRRPEKRRQEKLFQETSLQRHGKNDDLGNEKSIKNRNMCPVAMKEVRRYETIGQKDGRKNENSKLIMILFWLLATITRKRFTGNSR